MNLNKKTQINSFLRGHKRGLILKLVLLRMSKLMFLMYVFFSLYLLVIDSVLITEIKLYENEYVSVIVCFLDIAVGFVLLLLTMKLSLNYKLGLLSVVCNYDIEKISFNSLMKYLSQQFYICLLKLTYFVAGVLPSAFIAVFTYNLLKNGVAVALLVVFSICDVLLFVCGIYNSICLIQKFAMYDYCFAENQEESAKKIIESSSRLMDGRCEELTVYKIFHLHLRLLGLFVPFFTVKESARELIIMTDKIIPHVRSRAHTEKSVVFYVGKTVIS